MTQKFFSLIIRAMIIREDGNYLNSLHKFSHFDASHKRKELEKSKEN